MTTYPGIDYGLSDTENAFVDAYLVALAFTAHDEDGNPPPEWINPGCDIRDAVSADDVRAILEPDDLAEIEADCSGFLRDNRADIRDEIERAAADFHFTRNGHGAGFWDGDWPGDVGRRLTDAAKVYGPCELFIVLNSGDEIDMAFLTH